MVAIAKNSTLRTRCLFFVTGIMALCVSPAALSELQSSAPVTEEQACVSRTYTPTTPDARAFDYVACHFDPSHDEIRLFRTNADGEPYGHFGNLNAALAASGETLSFAMNAGMYHRDRRPVGLYVGVEQKLGEIDFPTNSNDGPGNFHLKPNGVFLIQNNGVAWVLETQKFSNNQSLLFRYATQSGPMLVIDGDIHPRFLPKSESLKRRNGVGVTRDGQVIFVIADTPVRFYDFAVLFRDILETPNALYLDGTISRIFAPELGRNDPGVPMGPIIGVVRQK